jgi:hypothetical protein
MKRTLFYVFIGMIFFFCLYQYYHSDQYQLKCIIASQDGNTYCVREREKLELAANLLASVTKKCKDLIAYIKNKYPKNQDVLRLSKQFNPNHISETLPTSTLEAYSENKGEKIAFCLNTSKKGNQLIDIDTLTFVAFHELSHIMTESIGHKQDFWKNFKFLLHEAKESGIYHPIDYKNNPQQYCGMTINDNPFYDFV